MGGCRMGEVGVYWGTARNISSPEPQRFLANHWLAPYFGFKVWTSLGDMHPLLRSLASATHINPHCQLQSPGRQDLLSLL